MKPVLIKWLISFLVVTGISGCTFDNAYRYEPTFNQVIYIVETNTDSSQVTETHTTTPQQVPQVIVKTLPAPPVHPPERSNVLQGMTALPCNPFTLPNATPQPLPPNFEDPTIKNQELDVMMAAYIKAMRAYIKNERKTLEDSHAIWLQGCSR